MSAWVEIYCDRCDEHAKFVCKCATCLRAPKAHRSGACTAHVDEVRHGFAPCEWMEKPAVLSASRTLLSPPRYGARVHIVENNELTLCGKPATDFWFIAGPYDPLKATCPRCKKAAAS